MTVQPATRSPWMDWKPKARIFEQVAETEPTKPSEPGFVGFDGAIPTQSPEIEAALNPAEFARASEVLQRAGVRLIRLEGAPIVGVWSDLDGPEIRAALYNFRLGGLAIRYLDGDRMPTRYKVRRVNGEPVPLSVLGEMEQNPAEPWKVRDRILKAIAWKTPGDCRRLHKRGDSE